MDSKFLKTHGSIVVVSSIPGSGSTVKSYILVQWKKQTNDAKVNKIAD